MTSPYGLDGRVALVTGGTRGIGLAVAEALVRAGAQVCAADPAHLSLLTEFTLDTFGRIDIVVNNAATNQSYGPLMDANPDTWREGRSPSTSRPPCA